MTTPAQVFQAVAEAFGVTPEQLVSQSRTERLSCARFAAWKIMRGNKVTTLAEIGQRTGERGHDTVMHGLKRADDLLSTNEDFRDCYYLAKAKLTITNQPN